MTKVINFFGGPGAGKSTLAAQTFGHMKHYRFNVEYVAEFAKDLVWSDSSCIDDQIHILGEQHHRMYRLLGKTDYIICDSPLLLSVYYANGGNRKYQENVKYENFVRSIQKLAEQCFDMYHNLNFFVERGNRKFVQEGRIHTENESIEIDKRIKDILDKNMLTYTHVTCLEDVLREQQF